MFHQVLVFQNPGAFKGVLQKVNPFRSASQVGTASSSLCRCVGVTEAGPLFSRRSPKANLQSHSNKEEFPIPTK